MTAAVPDPPPPDDPREDEPTPKDAAKPGDDLSENDRVMCLSEAKALEEAWQRRYRVVAAVVSPYIYVLGENERPMSYPFEVERSLAKFVASGFEYLEAQNRKWTEEITGRLADLEGTDR